MTTVQKRKDLLRVSVYLALGLLCLFAGTRSGRIAQSFWQGVWVTDSNVDLGTFHQGQVVRHSFDLWNVSPRTVKIHRVAPTCQCSFVESSSARIPPLRRSRLRMEVNTSVLHPGHQKKGLIIDLSNRRRIEAMVDFSLLPKDGKHRGN